jgi:hypothetical protein
VDVCMCAVPQTYVPNIHKNSSVLYSRIYLVHNYPASGYYGTTYTHAHVPWGTSKSEKVCTTVIEEKTWIQHQNSSKNKESMVEKTGVPS